MKHPATDCSYVNQKQVIEIKKVKKHLARVYAENTAVLCEKCGQQFVFDKFLNVK